MQVSSLDAIVNPHLKKWIQEMFALCRPDDLHIVDGSKDELQAIQQKLVKDGTFIPLNPEKRPNSFLARSNPDDVARVEDRTFICSENPDDAGPTNNWMAPEKMKEKLLPLFSGCMQGRTMYVVCFCMGPIGSPYSKIAVQITDSAYVVASMAIMTSMGKKALEMLGNESFVKCLHSVGAPIQEKGQKSDSWPCNPENLYISHFPETLEVWSFGSGYGGNALLNKKCFALRIASTMAKKEGWMAEHMLIVGITNPKGVKRYFAASFPSACGKTNLAMLESTLPGWKVECVGDDIAWMHWQNDKLYAINPEAGFFGVAPGTSNESNPNAMRSFDKNAVFTNVAYTDDGDVWWEDMTKKAPEHCIDWKGNDWTPDSETKAAHPNARFTAPISQCPVVDPGFTSLQGVEISGIIFGGRRSDTVPLVREAHSWEHGVFLGATMTSEMTAAAKGQVGKVRHDPFAMLPFCGYHMGDYFSHWLSMKKPSRQMPKIFYVNWFQKDDSGRFIWPGFGDNIRVLEWMFERFDNTVTGKKTSIGIIPKKDELNLEGLKISDKDLSQLLDVNKALWQKECQDFAHYFESFGNKLPDTLKRQLMDMIDETQRDVL